MEFVGYIVCWIFLIGVTLVWCLTAPIHLGKYNLGGVPNPLTKKLATLAVAGLIGYCGYELVLAAPFELVAR